MNLLLLQEEDLCGADRACIGGRRLQHLRQVLGSQTGDCLRVGLLNGPLGEGLIEQLDARQAVISLHWSAQPPDELPVRLVLALPRPKVLGRVLQSVAALGVKQLVLVNSWRVDKSYWSSPLLQPAALRQQLLLGLEQGVDTRLPQILLRSRFKPFVEDELHDWCGAGTRLVAHPAAAAPCPAAQNGFLTLAIGPEGGFIPYEIEALQAQGFTAVHLGRRILRVETAVAFLLGRLSSG
ncbi:MAG: 16S rRNA (uracil(1498)-N(3))-methyltransferase [Desulfuromonas thiophila]|nr:16S rRNA (uracil(1498)-N(3))-methyltransferase [Desulfuromonas thiophila]